MFETNLFKYDFDLVPEASTLFSQMEVKHEPLTLIVPQFETPLLGIFIFDKFRTGSRSLCSDFERTSKSAFGTI